MERDFVGYGANPPRVKWPNDARIVVSIVINYEEGSERSLACGDATQESYKEYPKAMPQGVRDLTNEQVYEYGSRVGIWRLLRILDKYHLNATVHACGMALEQNPEAVGAIIERGHEICSHGYRWIETSGMSEQEERAFIRRSIEAQIQTTGQRPLGWYCRYGPSLRTRKLLIEEGGFEYDSDSVADELPFYKVVDNQAHVVVPYTIDVNDMKFWSNAAFGNGEDFFAYLRDAFDQLYEEGDEYTRMMSVALHPRIVGRPARARGLDRFFRHLRGHENVWVARRLDIARHWRAVQPYVLTPPRQTPIKPVEKR
jgi:peptidoglycan/xylan/chitin deacetylase (PgdA/CDA1 family)